MYKVIILLAISLMVGKSLAQPDIASPEMFCIYVGTLPANEELSQFADLYDLGSVRIEHPAEGPLKRISRSTGASIVFLGNFIDRQTADQILLKTHQLGYQDAYVEPFIPAFRDSSPQSLYTVQLGAFSRPYFNGFSRIENVFAHGMFTQQQDGLFKVSAGLYQEKELKYVRREVIPWLRNQGYDAFIRRI
ncbi:MAG: hypothetical protein AAF206_02540 [Bacteroidota bacterium]